MAKVQSRILVVEDENGLREALKQLVSSAGYAVTTAANGTEAIALIQKTKFDLALLDIRMAEVSGLDVLKVIRQQSPTTKAVILTGYANLKNAMEAKEYGAVDFLIKPYNLEDVLVTIERALTK